MNRTTEAQSLIAQFPQNVGNNELVAGNQPIKRSSMKDENDSVSYQKGSTNQ